MPAEAVVRDGAVLVEVRAPLGADETAGLAARVRAVLRSGAGQRVVCRISGPVDLGVVDALARLRLVASRAGAGWRVTGCAELTGLLAVVGLGQLCGGPGPEPGRPGLPGPPGSEPVGQAEAGEQRRVEEVVDVRDPSA